MKTFDDNFLTEKIKTIAGTDEAGRGPLAGPVVAAAVIFDHDTIIMDINDSKKLTEKQREKLFQEIIEKAVTFSINVIDNNEIDKINILQASLKAMKISTESLNVKPDLILIDGNKTFLSDIKTLAIVKGDSKSHSIAAASILAKVTRDRIMIELDRKYPIYEWKQNKGYPTKKHRELILKYGVTEYHRKTFLKKIIHQELNLFDNE